MADVTFLVILWWFWRFRNDSVLRSKDFDHYKICKTIEIWNNTLMDVFAPSTGYCKIAPRLVSWTKPTPNNFKVNTDGSSFGNPGQAGFGGIIRNSAGNWVTGFSGYLGYTTCMHAELAAIHQGLLTAADFGLEEVALESDSLEAITIIKKGDCSTHIYGTIIQDIRCVLQSKRGFSIHHVLREANFCADFLAKIGAQGDTRLIVWEGPPQALLCHLFADLVGVQFPRL